MLRRRRTSRKGTAGTSKRVIIGAIAARVITALESYIFAEDVVLLSLGSLQQRITVNDAACDRTFLSALAQQRSIDSQIRPNLRDISTVNA